VRRKACGPRKKPTTTAISGAGPYPVELKADSLAKIRAGLQSCRHQEGPFINDFKLSD